MAKLFLEASSIEMNYGMRRVLNVKRFSLYDGERVGLVGENGAGKSTLMKILEGTVLPDAGEVRRFARVAAISQLGDTDVSDDTMDARFRSEFSAQNRRAGLSGGERTRRRIAGALSGGAQVLLADEPTVDLDAEGVKTLEKHLLNHDGAMVLVSHDRELLEKVCTRVCELTDGELTDFPGGYAEYRAERERRKQFERDEYEDYRAEQARIRKMIQREAEHASQKQHLPSRMGNSEARLHKREVTNAQAKIHQSRKSFESRLNRLEEKKRPREDAEIRIALGDAGGITSRAALRLARLTLRAGERTLLRETSLEIPARARTALIGENGCGKTTLLRRIVEEGEGVFLSPGVRTGYFGQDHAEVLDFSKTVLENVMRVSLFSEGETRTVLARLNIREGDMFKPAGVLSGGVRAKTAIARLLVSDVNFLILDEPTNHLDMFSMEALESVLSEYCGTLLFVSHDRAFVREVASRLVFFENGALTPFEGGVSEWEEEQEKKRTGEEETRRRMEMMKLEMKLADVSARMSAPRKGDHPEELEQEYLRLAEELREIKSGNQGR